MREEAEETTSEIRLEKSDHPRGSRKKKKKKKKVKVNINEASGPPDNEVSTRPRTCICRRADPNR
jgi:hypothetical protein